MSEIRVHIRRGRRRDFTAVMALLAASGKPLPLPERRTLRRFRQIVDDLGGDFYLALVDDQIAGLVHIQYTRRLAEPPRAEIAGLIVADGFRQCGVGTALLELARERAGKRGCGKLACIVDPRDARAQSFLERSGLRAVGREMSAELLQAGAESDDLESTRSERL